MDISIVIICMCLLLLVLCKEIHTNTRSQLIRLFEKRETYRVPDVLAFVSKKGYTSNKDLYMLKIDSLTRAMTTSRIVYVETDDAVADVVHVSENTYIAYIRIPLMYTNDDIKRTVTDVIDKIEA